MEKENRALAQQICHEMETGHQKVLQSLRTISATTQLIKDLESYQTPDLTFERAQQLKQQYDDNAQVLYTIGKVLSRSKIVSDTHETVELEERTPEEKEFAQQCMFESVQKGYLVPLREFHLDLSPTLSKEIAKQNRKNLNVIFLLGKRLLAAADDKQIELGIGYIKYAAQKGDKQAKQFQKSDSFKYEERYLKRKEEERIQAQIEKQKELTRLEQQKKQEHFERLKEQEELEKVRKQEKAQRQAALEKEKKEQEIKRQKEQERRAQLREQKRREKIQQQENEQLQAQLARKQKEELERKLTPCQSQLNKINSLNPEDKATHLEKIIEKWEQQVSLKENFHFYYFLGCAYKQYAQLKTNDKLSLLQKAAQYFKKEDMQSAKAEKKLKEVTAQLRTIRNRKKRKKRRRKQSKQLSLQSTTIKRERIVQKTVSKQYFFRTYEKELKKILRKNNIQKYTSLINRMLKSRNYCPELDYLLARAYHQLGALLLQKKSYLQAFRKITTAKECLDRVLTIESPQFFDRKLAFELYFTTSQQLELLHELIKTDSLPQAPQPKPQKNTDSQRATLLSLNETSPINQTSILHIKECQQGLQLLNMITTNINQQQYEKAENFANQLIIRWEKEYKQNREKKYLSYLLGCAYFNLSAVHRNMPTFTQKNHELFIPSLEKAAQYLQEAHIVNGCLPKKQLDVVYSSILFELANCNFQLFELHKNNAHSRAQAYAYKAYNYYRHYLSYSQHQSARVQAILKMLVKYFPHTSFKVPKNIEHVVKEYQGYSQICQQAFNSYQTAKNNPENVEKITMTIFLCASTINSMSEKLNSNPFLHLIIGQLFRFQAELFKLLPNELYTQLSHNLPEALPSKEQKIIELFNKSIEHLQCARKNVNPSGETKDCYSYHDASIEYFRSKKSLRDYLLKIEL